MRNLLIAAIILASGSASAQENAWWHGTFIPEGSFPDCNMNDGLVEYQSEEVYPWETACKITQKTQIRGMDGILLDLDCSFPDGGDGYKERQLLVKIDEQKIFRHPGGERILRCPVSPSSSPAGCRWPSQVWRAQEPNSPEVYQELQFVDGVSSGTALITEYRNGNKAWIATGEFGCSNGASICRITFPGVVSKEPFILPFETVGASGSPSFLVIPTFYQSVYYSERTALTDQYLFTGLQAQLVNGFRPGDEEVLYPNNVYEYSHCSE